MTEIEIPVPYKYSGDIYKRAWDEIRYYQKRCEDLEIRVNTAELAMSLDRDIVFCYVPQTLALSDDAYYNLRYAIAEDILEDKKTYTC